MQTLTLVKSIAEELRGLAVEYDVLYGICNSNYKKWLWFYRYWSRRYIRIFWSAATADLMFALITSDELEDLDTVSCQTVKESI